MQIKQSIVVAMVIRLISYTSQMSIACFRPHNATLAMSLTVTLNVTVIQDFMAYLIF